MTHVKALQAGHSSQGTSEPITPARSQQWHDPQSSLSPVPCIEFWQLLARCYWATKYTFDHPDNPHTSEKKARKYMVKVCVVFLEKRIKVKAIKPGWQNIHISMLAHVSCFPRVPTNYHNYLVQLGHYMNVMDMATRLNLWMGQQLLSSSSCSNHQFIHTIWIIWMLICM